MFSIFSVPMSGTWICVSTLSEYQWFSSPTKVVRNGGGRWFSYIFKNETKGSLPIVKFWTSQVGNDKINLIFGKVYNYWTKPIFWVSWLKKAVNIKEGLNSTKWQARFVRSHCSCSWPYFEERFLHRSIKSWLPFFKWMKLLLFMLREV